MSTSTLAQPAVQLDILAELNLTPDIELTRGDDGHYWLVTRHNGWRAKYTGSRWGWVFQRNTPWGWETWEADLPFGVEIVDTEADAREVLGWCVEAHGDDPDWLTKLARRRRRAA